MSRHEDLYKILQVHPTADIEVIKAVYKKLSQKYHPDKNKGKDAEKKMKQLNYAYSILGNELERKKYDVSRSKIEDVVSVEESYPMDEDVMSAQDIILDYFTCLYSGEREKAYELITDEEKDNISLKDFCEWQAVVNSIYQIKEYTISFISKVVAKKEGRNYDIEKYRFDIKMVEKEIVNGKTIKTELIKTVIKERGQYRLFLGYNDLKKMTKKIKTNYQQSIDVTEFEFDRQILTRKISKEIAHASRYNRIFTIVLLEIKNIEQFEKGRQERFVKGILLHIRKNIRRTDICGRWHSNRIMLILPETGVPSAKIATDKLFQSIKEWNATLNDEESVVCCAGILRYMDYSIQEFIDIAVSNVLKAKEKGDWEIVV